MRASPKDKDLTLIQLFDRFADDGSARHHLESVLWKNGIVCPHCQCNDQTRFGLIKPNMLAKTRAGLRWCSNCKSKFTVTIGTIFEDSHIPLRKWLIAWYLLCSSKKGISSLQLKRLLELGSYRSALFMAHRIRYALKVSGYSDKLEGMVETDDVFIGGVTKGKGTGGFLVSKILPIRGFDFILASPSHDTSQAIEDKFMSETKPLKKPTLPEWAIEPLDFAFDPTKALAKGAYSKPKMNWAKVITTGRRKNR